MINTLPYRLGVGLVIINDQSKIFTGRRLDSTKAWQMPQGGIDDNEIPLEAAYREMFEETGIEKCKVSLLKQSKIWYRYDLPKEIQGKFWGGKFRGQSQKWFLFRFNGSNKDININTKYQEFSDWKWSKKTDMLESIVPFKKSLYQSVLKDFDLDLKN
jgi:putative (di)nucleoside polyphosphate hydrolase